MTDAQRAIYERARACGDDHVRHGVTWLRSRGLGQVASWLVMAWAIERAVKEAVGRSQWPA